MRPRPPQGGRDGARGEIKSLIKYSLILLRLPHASAVTVSAQVSTFVRIESSEYEVRLMLCRVNVTI